MGALSFIREHGLTAAIADDGMLEIRGLASIPPEKAAEVVEYARRHKPDILAALARKETGGCEDCQASGFWDYAGYSGKGLLCFHAAFFLGKPGRPTVCAEMQGRCPLVDGNR